MTFDIYPRRRELLCFSLETADLVRLIRESDRPVGAICDELDLSESMVRRWMKQAEVGAGRGNRELTSAEREELVRLRKQNRELKMERDIPKKAAGGLNASRRAAEIPLHPGGEGLLSADSSVPSAAGFAIRFLCVAWPWAVGALDHQSGDQARDHARFSREPVYGRQPRSSPRALRIGVCRWRKPRCPPNARNGNHCAAEEAKTPPAEFATCDGSSRYAPPAIRWTSSTPDQRAEIERCLHLDEPIANQFGIFEKNVFNGTLGHQCPNPPYAHLSV